MKQVYVLEAVSCLGGGGIVCIADDFERCSEEQARYTAAEQSRMKITVHQLLESGD